MLFCKTKSQYLLLSDNSSNFASFCDRKKLFLNITLGLYSKAKVKRKLNRYFGGWWMVLENRPLLPTHSHLYITPLGNLTFLLYCLSFGLSQIWGICYIFQVFDASLLLPCLDTSRLQIMSSNQYLRNTLKKLVDWIHWILKKI